MAMSLAAGDRAVAGRRAGRSCGAGPRSTGCACRSRWSRWRCPACCRRPSRDARPFDAVGAVLLAVCMSTLLAVAGLVAARAKCRALAGGRVAGGRRLASRWAYVRRARHVARADHPARAVRRSDFHVPNVMNVLASLAGFSILLLTPYYLVNVLQLSAARAAGWCWRSPCRRQPGRRAAGGLPRAAHRPAADGLCRHRASSAWLCCRSACTDAATPIAVVALLLVVRGRRAGPARRRLYRSRDRHPAARATAASPAAWRCSPAPWAS